MARSPSLKCISEGSRCGCGTRAVHGKRCRPHAREEARAKSRAPGRTSPGARICISCACAPPAEILRTASAGYSLEEARLRRGPVMHARCPKSGSADGEWLLVDVATVDDHHDAVGTGRPVGSPSRGEGSVARPLGHYPLVAMNHAPARVDPFDLDPFGGGRAADVDRKKDRTTAHKRLTGGALVDGAFRCDGRAENVGAGRWFSGGRRRILRRLLPVAAIDPTGDEKQEHGGGVPHGEMPAGYCT